MVEELPVAGCALRRAIEWTLWRDRAQYAVEPDGIDGRLVRKEVHTAPKPLSRVRAQPEQLHGPFVGFYSPDRAVVHAEPPSVEHVSRLLAGQHVGNERPDGGGVAIREGDLDRLKVLVRRLVRK
eukprot:2240923-Prymnesium_polylepis.1